MAEAYYERPAYEVDLLIDVYTGAMATRDEAEGRGIPDAPVRDPERVPAWVAQLPAN